MNGEKEDQRLGNADGNADKEGEGEASRKTAVESVLARATEMDTTRITNKSALEISRKRGVSHRTDSKMGSRSTLRSTTRKLPGTVRRAFGLTLPTLDEEREVPCSFVEFFMIKYDSVRTRDDRCSVFIFYDVIILIGLMKVHKSIAKTFQMGIIIAPKY